jgi:methylmalonyl-CoA mutase
VEASDGTAEAGAADPAPCPKVEAIAGRRSLSRLDPWANLLRAGSAMVGAALGGADTLITLPAASALGIPRHLSRRLARNLQLVLAEEAHLHRVIDPAGGSWALERLTDRLAETAWAQLQSIEGRGGLEQGLGAGWLQAEIAETARQRAERAARRRDVMVGVNDFCDASAEIAAEGAGEEGASPPPIAATPAERPDPLAELSLAEAVRAIAGGASLSASHALVEPPFEPLPVRRTAEPFERQLDDPERQLNALTPGSASSVGDAGGDR